MKKKIIYSLLTVVISNNLQNDLFVIIITSHHSFDCIESDYTIFFITFYIFLYLHIFHKKNPLFFFISEQKENKSRKGSLRIK